VERLYSNGWTSIGNCFFHVPKVCLTTFLSIECRRLYSSSFVSGLWKHTKKTP
jgi:hypothetical protein